MGSNVSFVSMSLILFTRERIVGAVVVDDVTGGEFSANFESEFSAFVPDATSERLRALFRFNCILNWFGRFFFLEN